MHSAQILGWTEEKCFYWPVLGKVWGLNAILLEISLDTGPTSSFLFLLLKKKKRFKKMSMSTSIYVCAWEARRSCRWLWATMRVLETECNSLKDQQGFLITEPFSPAPQPVLTKTKILNFSVCEHAYNCKCHRGQLARVSSLLPRGFLGLNSGHHLCSKYHYPLIHLASPQTLLKQSRGDEGWGFRREWKDCGDRNWARRQPYLLLAICYMILANFLYLLTWGL